MSNLESFSLAFCQILSVDECDAVVMYKEVTIVFESINLNSLRGGEVLLVFNANAVRSSCDEPSKRVGFPRSNAARHRCLDSHNRTRASRRLALMSARDGQELFADSYDL